MKKIITLLRLIKNNQKEATLLITILLLAAFLRLWRIDEYLPFLGDEGRDVRVVRRFLTDFDLMFVGPRTSIGDMYLGPLYYYLIAPFLGIFNFSPTGPAAFVALLSTATVGLVWLAAREWFGKVAAFTSAFLFAISPVVIGFARHSWNPNIMPFFSLLCIYSVWRVWKKHEWWWSVVFGISFAFVLQSHYLGLLLLPTMGIFWLVTLFEVISKKQKAKRFLVFSLVAFSLFTILMSPLVIFDAKHEWRNFGALLKFFADRQTTVSVKPWNAIPDLWPLWSDNLVTRFLTTKNELWGKWSALILAVSALTLLLRNFLSLVPQSGVKLCLYSDEKSKKRRGAFFLVCTWTLVGLVGLGLYKQAIYDHYFGFMFPVPFLLTGAVLQELWNRRFKWVVFLVATLLIWANLLENPLKYPPQRQMQRIQEINRKIIEESGGQPFNFGLIAKRNYEEGYLYFLELWNAPVKEIDAQRSGETITEQLFVVCEETAKLGEPDPCNPINHPKAEIANFGWSRADKEWEVGGFRLFKLVRAQ